MPGGFNPRGILEGPFHSWIGAGTGPTDGDPDGPSAGNGLDGVRRHSLGPIAGRVAEDPELDEAA